MTLQRSLVLGLLLVAGCGGGATGSLVIDGQRVQIEDCESGEHARAPNSVELTTSAGRFRFSRTNDGQAEISYLVSGLATPGGIPVPLQRRNVISGCGPMTFSREDYMQNTVYPVSGTATIECSNTGSSDPDPHTFSGSFTFDRCR